MRYGVMVMCMCHAGVIVEETKVSERARRESGGILEKTSMTE
jgi:hypothetical protein